MRKYPEEQDESARVRPNDRPTDRLADFWPRCVAAELTRGSGCLEDRKRKESCLATAFGGVVKTSLAKVYVSGDPTLDDLIGSRKEERASGKVLWES